MQVRQGAPTGFRGRQARAGGVHRGLLLQGDLDALRERSGRTRLSEIFLRLCGQAEHVLPERPA